MAQKNLIIIGARGFGRVLYDLALCCIKAGLDIKIKGFLDDKADALDGFASYPPILSSVEDYVVQPDDVFTCALGSPQYKKIYVDMIKAKGGIFINLIHPTAHVGINSTLGEGCILCMNTNIGQDVKVGSFVTLDGYASIGHDATVGDYSHIGAYSFAAGYCQIGENVVMHPRVSVVPHKKIGDNATVGVGSVVISNVKSGTTVFGYPAKKIEV